MYASARASPRGCVMKYRCTRLRRYIMHTRYSALHNMPALHRVAHVHASPHTDTRLHTIRIMKYDKNGTNAIPDATLFLCISSCCSDKDKIIHRFPLLHYMSDKFIINHVDLLPRRLRIDVPCILSVPRSILFNFAEILEFSYHDLM